MSDSERDTESPWVVLIVWVTFAVMVTVATVGLFALEDYVRTQDRFRRAYVECSNKAERLVTVGTEPDSSHLARHNSHRVRYGCRP